MPYKMVYAARFIEDASCVWSGRLRAAIVRALSNIEEFPEIGSQNLPASVKDEFDDSVRKVAIKPFDLVYEFKKSENAVYIYALVPMRSIR
ncbi:MAG: sirohydrochlorin cobaltochelatase [Slackia sp.]|nr:sirohydrochlorin cobaltochelatase [Slackia sp.]